MNSPDELPLGSDFLGELLPYNYFGVRQKWGNKAGKGEYPLIASETAQEAQAEQKAKGDEEAHVEDQDYVEALQYGLPPTGGLGFGVDRFVMILTNNISIREVLAFPHLKPEN